MVALIFSEPCSSQFTSDASNPKRECGFNEEIRTIAQRSTSISFRKRAHCRSFVRRYILVYLLTQPPVSNHALNYLHLSDSVVLVEVVAVLATP